MSYRGYEFLEWLRTANTESAANTYTEVEVKTPVGRANNLAMACFEVEFEIKQTNLTFDDGDGFDLQLLMNTGSALVGIDSSNFIAARGHFVDGAVAAGLHGIERFLTKRFSRPILIAKSSLYFAIQGTSQGGALDGGLRIGYVLRRVSATRMVQALVD